MISVKRIFLVAVSFIGFSDLNAQVLDTVATDSKDYTTEFFQQGEKTTTPQKVLLVTKAKKTVSLTNFLKSITAFSDENTSLYLDYCFSDLDGDATNELVISNFTGGAHCCDEMYIFKNIAPNKYQYVVKMYAGHTSVTPKKEFEFGFYESFGYFFTCYACGYGDTTDGAPIPLREITLRYNKGKLSVVPGDQELRSTINDNLGKLGEQPFEKLDDELAMDEGLRKEFAMNLAVFYYSFGRNLPETKKLFDKYYKHPDAKKVWTDFTEQLQSLRKENDF